jgi:hypothetical protein
MNFRFAITSIIVCLYTSIGFSQHGHHKWLDSSVCIISATAGLSIPYGDFSDYFRKNKSSYFPSNVIGGAEQGVNARFELSYYFLKKTAVVMGFSATHNEVKEVPYTSLYPPSQVPSLGGSHDTYDYSYKSTPWYTASLMFGFTHDLRVGRTVWSPRILLAYQEINSPRIEIFELRRWRTEGDPPNLGTYTRETLQPATSMSNMAFDIGINVRVGLAKHFLLMGSIDLLISDVSFKNEISYVYDYPEPGKYVVPSDFKEMISFRCLNLGVAYQMK